MPTIHNTAQGRCVVEQAVQVQERSFFNPSLYIEKGKKEENVPTNPQN
jgi:hypothetical protein